MCQIIPFSIICETLTANLIFNQMSHSGWSVFDLRSPGLIVSSLASKRSQQIMGKQITEECSVPSCEQDRINSETLPPAALVDKKVKMVSSSSLSINRQNMHVKNRFVGNQNTNAGRI